MALVLAPAEDLIQTNEELNVTERKAKEARDAIVEMVFETIEELGELSENLRERIQNEENIHSLKSMYKAAMRADAIQQFEEEVTNL